MAFHTEATNMTTEDIEDYGFRFRLFVLAKHFFCISGEIKKQGSVPISRGFRKKNKQ